MLSILVYLSKPSGSFLTSFLILNFFRNFMTSFKSTYFKTTSPLIRNSYLYTTGQLNLPAAHFDVPRINNQHVFENIEWWKQHNKMCHLFPVDLKGYFFVKGLFCVTYQSHKWYKHVNMLAAFDVQFKFYGLNVKLMCCKSLWISKSFHIFENLCVFFLISNLNCYNELVSIPIYSWNRHVGKHLN